MVRLSLLFINFDPVWPLNRTQFNNFGPFLCFTRSQAEKVYFWGDYRCTVGAVRNQSLSVNNDVVGSVIRTCSFTQTCHRLVPHVDISFTDHFARSETVVTSHAVSLMFRD